jgi:hypothetical protein
VPTVSKPIPVTASSHPFGGAEYPTDGDYVRKVVRSTGQLVADRFVTSQDGVELIREAATSDIP